MPGEQAKEAAPSPERKKRNIGKIPGFIKALFF